jgi:hypothetical protein
MVKLGIVKFGKVIFGNRESKLGRVKGADVVVSENIR